MVGHARTGTHMVNQALVKGQKNTAMNKLCQQIDVSKYYQKLPPLSYYWWPADLCDIFLEQSSVYSYVTLLDIHIQGI